MSRIMRAVPRTASPPSYAASDFPGCARWYQFLTAVKTNGTVLVDKMGNDTTMTVVQNGTGNADATPNSLTCNSVAGNEVYATGGALITLGTKSLIIELDFNPTDSAVDGASCLENGDTFSNNRGWALSYGNANNSLLFRCRNAANNNEVSTTLGNLPNLEGSRKHTCLVWDRNVADPGSIGYYVGGVLQGTYALSGTVGTMVDPIGNGFKIGIRTSGARPVTNTTYNVRIWTLDSIPTNIAQVVVQMAKNPDEFPSLMAGIS